MIASTMLSIIAVSTITKSNHITTKFSDMVIIHFLDNTALPTSIFFILELSVVYTVFDLLCLDSYPCFARVKVIDWSRFGVLGIGWQLRCFFLLPVILPLLVMTVFPIKSILYSSHQL